MAGKRKDREAKRNAGHSHNGVRARRAGANAVVFTFYDSKFTALLVLEAKMADSGRTLCTVALGSKIALSETRYAIENLLFT